MPTTPRKVSVPAISPDDAVPTVEDVLRSAAGPCGSYRWDAGDGGWFELDRDDLLAALTAAYDPLMPSWPALVESYLAD